MKAPTWDIVPEKGERILWQGQPQRRCTTQPWWWFHACAAVFWLLLLWGLTGPVPQGGEGFHEWATHGFCRGVMLILAALTTLMPFLAARTTNGSTYVVTNMRLVIRKPWFGGSHYTQSYAYTRMHLVRVTPMGEGLASVRFDGSPPTTSESTQEIVFAIPATVANEIAALIRRS